MVFLAGRGRNRVNRSGMGQDLVLETNAAAVYWAIINPELEGLVGGGKKPGDPGSKAG